jgi:small subunit ribosomal protein S6
LRHYEGLFLFASRENKPDHAGVEQHVTEILRKHGANVLKSQKWVERKLAYEVKRNRRGAYLLVYFDADPQALATMRRDLQISERLLRHVILATEEVPQELSEFMEFKEEPLGFEGEGRGRWGGRGREERGPRGPRRTEEHPPGTAEHREGVAAGATEAASRAHERFATQPATER